LAVKADKALFTEPETIDDVALCVVELKGVDVEVVVMTIVGPPIPPDSVKVEPEMIVAGIWTGVGVDGAGGPGVV
jgi:hypothetical protein